ncbi:Histone-lysine N-methyltransferase [Phytophthora cinnamomi]|uniref:Histone-lysine N-methyltransferase n=1 Tax=Phytophthora cinnamomi TaxID=4785 RepID=UPI0035594E4C|nr:Histone-lysine N-methyltransferase [Phytophthora cinnamomi]
MSSSMAVRAPSRRRRDASLGRIPLSSGEIELYSRQDEAARRRRRLLAVRDQERRLAQQVTQRYRQNLQRLQRGKSGRARAQLSTEQRALLTELHARYQSSLQSMGAAQRGARRKLLELMEAAHDERDKWAFNTHVAGQQRVLEAREQLQIQEQERTRRQRQVQQSVQRLKEMTAQQRQQASARARQEQQLATQRAKDRKEAERLRREQSPEEAFVTPRPSAKDVLAYRFTRTHCVAPSGETPADRPTVTVIRHNSKHPAAVCGEKEAEKYRDEMDRRRERDRVVLERQGEMAAQRGNDALEDVASRQRGQQALEWLALVDKMERRARGQDFGEEQVALDAGDVDGAEGDRERMVESAFARMLGLDEHSVELSAFSIETDDDRQESEA